MKERNRIDEYKDRRGVKRLPTKSTYTAEIKLSDVPIHQLKLRDASSSGACLLVKKGSAMLNHIAVDQELNIKFHSYEKDEPAGLFKSIVRHITQGAPGRYGGHYLVGIKILGRLGF
jgi:hypothetical protein